jgi:lysyl-tRNA synthetase class II
MFENMQRIQGETAAVVSRLRPLRMGRMVHRRTQSLSTNVLMVCIRSDKLTAKAQKITIKLPWEITTMYSEVLKNSGHQSDDEEDEDDIEAHEASIQRLKVRHI